MKNLLITASLLLAATLTAGAKQHTVSSPDGHIRLTFTDGRTPYYNIAVDGRELIGRSRLGLAVRDWTMPTGSAKTVRTSADETWTQPWGENKTNRNHYNELAATMSRGSARLIIRFRVFYDGAAFRYEISDPQRKELTVTDELTQFAFAQDGTSWSIPGNFETYELEYREQPISATADANTPYTFTTDPQLWGSIHEAALYDYPEMRLLRDSVSGILKADLAPLPDGVKAYIPSTFSTPWRTIQIAPSAVALINSALILNLNEPSKIKDTSWIEPQKYVGVWWGMHLGTQVWTPGPQHGATTENALKTIDFAAANDIQGVLFEGWNEGWENWGGNQHFDYVKPAPDFDLPRIARYAREKGIELWMHNETGGNIPEYEAEMERAFAEYQRLGVHTLKTGYAGGFKGGYLHHSQYGVRHYQRVVELAAKYQLMIDAHEPIKETGIRRTWPNMMTREGARGMEWNAWSEGNSSTYLCTLPFVRLLSGPMDYTPGIFDINYERAKADTARIEWNGPNGHTRIKTTLARQIANWVIIYSPLQMGADQIENYQGHPAFQFFRDFNADCDWSEALQGYPGQYIATARRAGNKYFLGAGTNSEARTLEIRLSFLPAGQTFIATVYADGSRPDRVEVYQQRVDSSTLLPVRMAPNGGQAIIFAPAE